MSTVYRYYHCISLLLFLSVLAEVVMGDGVSPLHARTDSSSCLDGLACMVWVQDLDISLPFPLVCAKRQLCHAELLKCGENTKKPGKQGTGAVEPNAFRDRARGDHEGKETGGCRHSSRIFVCYRIRARHC